VCLQRGKVPNRRRQTTRDARGGRTEFREECGQNLENAHARTAEQLHWDSVAAGPRWAVVISEPNDSAWFDRKSIVRIDSQVYRVWWKSKDTLGTWTQARWQSEFACGARTWRDLRTVDLDSTGKRVGGSEQPSDPGTAVPPESKAETLLRTVCGYAASRNLPIVRP
jgi:hypothetical protein